MPTIRPRERDALLQSLRAGVVPRLGQYLIQVGRVEELKALIADIDRVGDGNSTFRLVIGEYGAGKTFFLNLVRSIALEKKLVTMHADLNPDRRLQASGGQARSLFAELTRNTATRTRPEGGALAGILEKFIAQAQGRGGAAQPFHGTGRAQADSATRRDGEWLRLCRCCNGLLEGVRHWKRTAKKRRYSLDAW